jgi:predicted ATPase
MNEFIERLTIKNYGCVKDVSVELTPLHAFIGPNDSGKSTLLRALRTVTQYGGGVFNGSQPFDPQFTDNDNSIDIVYSDKIAYKIGPLEEGFGETVYVDGTTELWSAVRNGINNPGLLRTRFDAPQMFELARRLRPARFVRLYADSLRQPTGLVMDGDPVRFLDERGLGLPAIYDVIINHNVEAFLKILAEVRRLFPSVARLGLINVSKSQKAIEVTLKDGRRIPAEAMSEGLLYYLAFAALPSLEPASMILIEEPENGLHPARIAEVMKVLREVSKTTQVVVATHSPLVINEMRPEEVSVVTRPPEKGTQVIRIDRTPDFEDRAKMYALGELWISYADGAYEAPLLEGREP